MGTTAGSEVEDVPFFIMWGRLMLVKWKTTYVREFQQYLALMGTYWVCCVADSGSDSGFRIC